MDFARRLVPTAIRRRYAVKFGIALLILGLSVGLIGFVATGAIADQVENRVQSDHASAAGQEAQSVQMWNEQNEHTIGTIARSDVVASDDPAAIERRFLDWQEHLDADTFDISYVNLNNGTVTASTNEAYRGAPATDIDNVPNEAYEEASKTVPWVSDAYLAEGEFGQNTTVLTYVQRSADNENRAIVYTADLEAYANQLQDEEGVTTVVLDGENDVMLDNADYGGNHQTFGYTYGDDTGLAQSARTEGATTKQVAGSSLSLGDYELDEDSGDYVASSARVFGTDWVVLTVEPADQALGFVNSVNQWGLVATILGVVMIGAVGAVLGRNTAVSIDRLTDKASEMEDGNLNVDLETKRIDNIGRLYDGFGSMRDALREQIEEAEAARMEAEQERERVLEINDHLEDKAAEYCSVMGEAADGDLTARADVESDNEQMQQIGEDFNEMLDEIEQTIAELNRFATDVATASEQVTASSEEVRSASQQVTESIQEISDGADRQNESLQSVNQEMSGLSTTTEEIAASSNEVADIAERTVDTGQEGQEAAQAAITAMDEIEIEAGDAVAEIRRLEEEVQQIDELINTISEIAHQTNMLALNANIEASRSAGGSDDEGFSVVAKEVKALSEDVAEAADEAEDRLEAIRKRTEASAAEVEGTSTDIENASNRVEEAVNALEEIADLAQETNVGVQEISAATEEQAASTQEVVAMVDDAATISEETTSEAENVAAAAEEQTTALTEVTKSASSLSEQASQLSEALDRFDTDVDHVDLDFESTFDVDAELDAPAAIDDDAADGESAEEGQGITFDADAASEQADSDETLTFDDADEDAHELEADEDADTADADPSTETAFEPETSAADPIDHAGDDPATDSGADGDATEELGAEEILGIEGSEDDESDAVESTDSTDPLADDAFGADGDETTDTTESTGPADPLADDTPESDGDDTADTAEPAGDEPDAQPLGSVDDGGNAETDDESAADETPTTDDPESDETDDSDGPDEGGDEDDDVFTFGATDEE
ncbi:methyl-accepting chemotaxis protein [Natrinema altunense]|uniref:Chemotaxis sensory transducer n=1 Tax=Natrinema altunense (strain JCM 12890 / CGMCC 1.3731 / AJ2) TaxID=1227494 RepID=L9ZFZ0_NATA2|nr:methyl-accepting chemotaxis protein [Natrinema altunense]ELY84093.1 chemotaxis sensory transducer [Natrinema altunense JCM 12890]